MKINARILLINFVVVALITVSSTVIFFSLTNTLLQKQQLKALSGAANDFSLEMRKEIEEAEIDFNELVSVSSNLNDITLDNSSVDLIFSSADDSLINFNNYVIKPGVKLNSKSAAISNFIKDNPDLVLRYAPVKNKLYFYGKIIDHNLLNKISERIDAEAAFISGGKVFESSNEAGNSVFLNQILEASKYFKLDNPESYSKRLEGNDFLAVRVNLQNYFSIEDEPEFIIFTVNKETSQFRSTMGMIMGIMLFAGIALSLILVLLFTSKFRRQVTLLSKATRIIRGGDLSYRVPVISKDEMGKFGSTFNNMLDELEKRIRAEEDYSDFIKLINKNPTLKEISDAALAKIVHTTELSAGVLFSTVEGGLEFISSYGIEKEFINETWQINFYRKAIEQKEIIELKFEERFPVIKTGLSEIELRYIVLVPIIYGEKVISVMELVSEKLPAMDIKEYINNIKDQLAIGLTNAKAFHQLEEIVDELKKLNEDYQKQNEKIVGQNDELKKLHHNLEVKANELEVQKQKAVELSKTKSQFLATVSHELKTPLNSILGLSELVLKQGNGNEESKRRLEIVLKNGKKLLSLINNILEFSKAEAGKIEIKKEEFYLSRLSDDISDFISPLTAEKNLAFTIKTPENTDYSLLTDREKLEQILLNLLSNAVKFTDDGFVKMFVSVLNNSDLQIKVADSGIGISEEDQKIIFEEFRQIDGSESRKYGGTGLGLSISAKYSEFLGGSLTFKSEAGLGTTFTLTLPGCVAGKSEFKKMPDIKKNNLNLKEKTLKNNVLIVDDDSDTLFTVGEIIKSLGCDVEFAKDGIECLEKLEDSTPDIILLDIMMPKMDGFETIKNIRNKEKLKNIPVFALTAHAMLDDKGVIEKNGFNDIVTKPLDTSVLAFKVQREFNKFSRALKYEENISS